MFGSTTRNVIVADSPGPSARVGFWRLGFCRLGILQARVGRIGHELRVRNVRQQDRVRLLLERAAIRGRGLERLVQDQLGGEAGGRRIVQQQIDRVRRGRVALVGHHPVGVAESGVRQIDVLNRGILQARVLQAGILQARVRDAGIDDARIRDRVVLQRRVLERRILQRRILQVRVLNRGVLQRRVLKTGVLQARILEARHADQGAGDPGVVGLPFRDQRILQRRILQRRILERRDCSDRD